jgi:hypothetical protein
MDDAHYLFRKKTSSIQATKYHRWKKRKDGTGGIEKSITSFFLLICAHFLIREETKGRQL